MIILQGFADVGKIIDSQEKAGFNFATCALLMFISFESWTGLAGRVLRPLWTTVKSLTLLCCWKFPPLFFCARIFVSVDFGDVERKSKDEATISWWLASRATELIISITTGDQK